MSKPGRGGKKARGSSFNVGAFGSAKTRASSSREARPGLPIDPWSAKITAPVTNSPEPVAGPSGGGGPSNAGSSSRQPSPSTSATLPFVHDQQPDEQCDTPGTGDGPPSKKKARANNTIPPSAHMKEFMEESEKAFAALLEREVGPTLRPQDSNTSDVLCPRCQDLKAPANFLRCYDCYHPPTICKQCIIDTHAQNPFHRVESWHTTDESGKGFWKRTSVCALTKIFLGHAGQKCPRNHGTATPMTIVHEHGIEVTNVYFCDCGQKDTPEPVPRAFQLIRFGLYPATWKQPSTAFTIHVMESFHLLSLQTQANARDFMIYLQRSKNNIFPGDVEDRYREFMTAVRGFAYLTAVKRAGVKPTSKKENAELAVLCPACPQPGINMDPKWKERPEEDVYLDALFHTVDGNFHSNQKVKRLDQQDEPLSMGAAYFANEREFKAIYDVKAAEGPPVQEASTCNQFAAMGLSGYTNKVSGTVGYSCARHMFVLPLGGVDLQKGERYFNVDFVTLFCFQRWMILKLFISGYDINCQYRINFLSRMDWFFRRREHIPSILHFWFPRTIAGIGKFHLPGHKGTCRYMYSFHYLPGVGMTDGEAPERIWSTLNTIGNSTREMTSGHRHDTINDFHSDQNVRRVHSIAKKTLKKHVQALPQMASAQAELDRVERAVDANRLEAWRTKEREFVENVAAARYDRLENIYEPKAETVVTKKQALEILNQESRQPMATTPRGLVGVIGEGIDLEEMRDGLLRRLSKKGAKSDDSAVEEACQRFFARVEHWRTLHDLYLKPLLGEIATQEAQIVIDATLDEDAEQALLDRQATDDAIENARAEEETMEDVMENTRTEEEMSQAGPGRKRKRTVDPSFEEAGTSDSPSGAGGAIDDPSDEAGSDLWMEVKGTVLELPSQFEESVRLHPAMTQAVRIEYQLREGQASDALDDLRSYLMTSYLVRGESKEASGQVKKTRAYDVVKVRNEAVASAARRYRQARLRLIALGLSSKDTRFRSLSAVDARPFKVFTTQETLGDSRLRPSWIWSTFEFIEDLENPKFKEFCHERVKVHWFRCSALRNRWREEINLLEEEMARIVRYFYYFMNLWHGRAEGHDEAGETALAAYARKQAWRHRQLYDQSVGLFTSVIGVLSL